MNPGMSCIVTRRGRGRGTVVDFRNPVKLQLTNNVKIVMDTSFTDGADLSLKQIQEMKPLVVIKRLLCSRS